MDPIPGPIEFRGWKLHAVRVIASARAPPFPFEQRKIVKGATSWALAAMSFQVDVDSLQTSGWLARPDTMISAGLAEQFEKMRVMRSRQVRKARLVVKWDRAEQDAQNAGGPRRAVR